ncbi:peptide deformylase [Corynebacterium yudongzhengii]|uniref:Peptide deformylase n=1 Tax=Corynebacterium yudongzhengii TaxID=2080740 RepID=A0A2U1T8C1_9CORY|nr:peptide deformylase [Corynebacterium yudongzhengii]AWB81839.1 peptide deformylase [Corynebacterium yudongzhengii]PWC02232.1 peptide deformylase [Corynebacterium yudongzhengii]
MTLREIRLFGDPVLTTQAAEVDKADFGSEKLRLQVEDMLETMDEAGGVGLAANQIGSLRRVIVFDTTHQPGGLRGHLINPRWQPLTRESQLGPEGCLSIPGISADTPRSYRVQASGYDVEGRPIGIAATGLLARCLQHEHDHLEGVLFLSRLDDAARREAMAAIRRANWFTTRKDTL